MLRIAIYENLWDEKPLSEIIGEYPESLGSYRTNLEKIQELSLEELTSDMPRVNRLSVVLSQPTFLVETLLDNLPDADAIELLKSLNEPRRYYLRPNRFRTDVEKQIEGLEESGALIAPDDEVPHISEVRNGIRHVIQSDAFKEGAIVIQDKASVIAVDSLEPRTGDVIWDACASPGMKTQLLAERTSPSGRVVGSDVYKSRVMAGSGLTRFLGSDNVEWIHSDATQPTVRDVDKILIDAPCTSTGVLQTFPSFKWRLNKRALFALMTVQNKILDGILNAFSGRPGTKIVFSTCSLLPHEGESQIDSAVERHNVNLLPPLDIGSPGYAGFSCSSMVRRLFPHKHHCNGFFIARLEVKQ
jgi:16S rRNA (cytosine967-C5)-methyltransferase